MKCKCGKGAAGRHDGICGFCRRSLLSAAERRKGRIRGDTCTFEQWLKIKRPSDYYKKIKWPYEYAVIQARKIIEGEET